MSPMFMQRVEEAQAEVPVISVAEAERRLTEDANAVVIDVRDAADIRASGIIPGAVHVPWETAVNENGSFKPADELHAAYAAAGVDGDREIIPYCTIGGRPGHTWFVLTQLLGYADVRLYEASWAEWGNRADTPVEYGGGRASS